MQPNFNTPKMSAIILIDFGMTASAAECFIIAPPDEFWPTKHHKFGKTPTRLLYGNNDEVIAWGSDCKNNHQSKMLFKRYFGIRDLYGTNKYRDTSTQPRSIEDLEKWISDYLYHFCGNVLNEVLRKESMTKEQLNAKWYLTTPGCWSDPTRLDFKMLAGEVFYKLLAGSEVFADITESLASCEFLVDSLRLPSGTWAITCDIGGATCDTALAFVQTVDRRPIPQVFPIAGGRSLNNGVGDIDKRFQLQIELQWKLSQTITALDLVLVKDLTNRVEWQHARHAFDASRDVVITAEQDLGKWKSPAGKLSVDGSKITVSRELMEEIFKPFVKDLCFEIDESLRKLAEKTPRNTRPDIIALCGGGGTMAYPLKQLKLRYAGIEIRVPSSTEESCLATIIGHRIYWLRRAMEDYLGEILLGVSSASSTKESPHTIIWQEDPRRITTFEFSSRRQKVIHYFIVHLTGCPRPRPISVDILKKNPGRWNGILIWALDVTLDRHWFGGQKYCIEVTCTGREAFSFKAYEAKNPGISLCLVSDTYFL